jgi:addiction module HigA family antidote
LPGDLDLLLAIREYLWIFVAMKPVHPGRLLKRELVARELSANKLALALRVPSGRITLILNGKRAITPETALRLGRYFGNSAEFWMNLQMRHDLVKAERDLGERINSEVEQAA